MIDSVIMGQARAHQSNLHTAFIDHQKAFYSDPHTWLIRLLEVYKVAPPGDSLSPDGQGSVEDVNVFPCRR